MEFSPTELITLVILIVGTPILSGVTRESALPGKQWFALAYGALLLSNVFTIVESWVAYTLFNALEHLTMTGFGILFVIAIRVFLRDAEPTDRTAG